MVLQHIFDENTVAGPKPIVAKMDAVLVRGPAGEIHCFVWGMGPVVYFLVGSGGGSRDGLVILPLRDSLALVDLSQHARKRIGHGVEHDILAVSQLPTQGVDQLFVQGVGVDEKEHRCSDVIFKESRKRGDTVDRVDPTKKFARGHAVVVEVGD